MVNLLNRRQFGGEKRCAINDLQHTNDFYLAHMLTRIEAKKCYEKKAFEHCNRIIIRINGKNGGCLWKYSRKEKITHRERIKQPKTCVIAASTGATHK